MRLTVVSPGGVTNPSTRVRALNWVTALSLDADVRRYIDTADVTAGTLARHPLAAAVAERDLRSFVGRPQHLLLQREASPLSSGSVERRLVRAHRHTAYDVDDALHLPRAFGSGRRLLGSHRKTAALAAEVDVVVAGSAALADWASGVARRLVVIPSCVDLSHYPVKRDYAVGDRATVLWMGSATTEPFLHALAPALEQLARRTPLRVLVLGARRGRQPELLQGIVERRAWSPEVARRSLLEADVGIMPLPDTAFTRGKCAYKLLEYAAAGLPVVGSPVGASARFLREAGAPTARTTVEWVTALRDVLLADTSSRRGLGRAARAVVERQYTYDVWKDEWRAAVLPS